MGEYERGRRAGGAQEREVCDKERAMRERGEEYEAGQGYARASEQE